MTEFINVHILPHIGEFFGITLAALGTGIGGFMFGKKKLNAELEGLNADNDMKEIENTDKVVKLYKEALDDLSGRYETKFTDFVKATEQKIKLIEESLEIQKRINEQYKAENNLLKAENTMLKTKLKDNGIQI